MIPNPDVVDLETQIRTLRKEFGEWLKSPEGQTVANGIAQETENVLSDFRQWRDIDPARLSITVNI